jgi:S1-C subfamily serine protease
VIRAALPAAGSLFCALALPAFAQDDADPARAIETRTQEIKETTAPAVVSVTVTPKAYPTPRFLLPGLRLGAMPPQPERIEGTGFFIESRGLLVTTRALVANAEKIEVRFCDGSTRDASVIGVDGPYRVAVLRTSAPDCTATLSQPQRVEAGSSTIGWLLGAAASGMPSAEIASSDTTNASGASTDVDVQVASVRPATNHGATYDRYLYAPMSLPRGAAGGPLVGCDGRLLGMAIGSLVAKPDPAPGVRSRLPSATLFVRGDDIADAARQIAANGYIERPMIGAMMQGETNRIDVPLPGSPAEAAGLAEGDAVIGVGPLSVASFADLTRALLRRHAGDPVKLTVERTGPLGPERFTRTVVLSPFQVPADPTTPPFPGAVLEVSCDGQGACCFTFAEVAADSAAAKAGVAVGDRLVTADGRPAVRFLQRHRARPQTVPPSKIEIERAGELHEITLTAQ